MLRPRIIPSLLIHNDGLVKTIKFQFSKYVGDPINAVRIFNEKEVDELAIFDIDATVLNKEPNYKLIEKLANQSRMPLCYGGGIKTKDQALRIFSLGIEKIAVSNSAVVNPNFISELAECVGSQSIVVVVDVKKKLFGGYEIFTHNAKVGTAINPVEFLKNMEKLGAGEVIINSIDHDGVMDGFDFNLIDKICAAISIPVTILGGAGSFDDIKKAIHRYGIIGVAAGSLFVFKGKYKAVLINYPEKHDRDSLSYLIDNEN